VKTASEMTYIVSSGALNYTPTNKLVNNKYDMIRYDTRCYINVRSKANMSQLNLPHATDN